MMLKPAMPFEPNGMADFNFHFMYKILFSLVFVAIIGLGFFKIENRLASRNKEMAVETAKKIGLGLFLQLIREGNITIVDMRRPKDFEDSHIKDALSFHLMDPVGIERKSSTARNIIIYSGGGVDDQMTQYADTLEKSGKNGVFIYTGGFREWKAAGLPIERK